jgi:hypothetical protein
MMSSPSLSGFQFDLSNLIIDEASCTIRGYILAKPTYFPQESEFKIKKNLRLTIDTFYYQQGYIRYPDVAPIEVIRGDRYSGTLPQYLIPVDYHTLELCEEKRDEDGINKSKGDYAGVIRFLSTLPPELLLEVLKRTTIPRIELLCSDATLYCIHNLWQRIVIETYGLERFLSRIRSSPDPTVRNRTFDWKSILEFLDSSPGLHGRSVGKSELQRNPRLFSNLMERAINKDDPFYFLLLGAPRPVQEKIGLSLDKLVYMIVYVTSKPLSDRAIDQINVIGMMKREDEEMMGEQKQ